MAAGFHSVTLLFRLSGIRSHSLLGVAWSRGSHQVVSELGSDTRSYHSVIFMLLLSIPWSFPVFSFISLFFLSASSNKKERGYISPFSVPSIQYLKGGGGLKRKEREIEAWVEIWRIIEILPQKTLLWRNISNPHRNQLKIRIPSIGVEIVSYVKFGLILTLISRGGGSIFISAAETLPWWTHIKTL